MSIEEKKLLLDIKESVLSIDDHLEGRRIFDETIIWKIIMVDIPVLLQEVLQLLES